MMAAFLHCRSLFRGLRQIFARLVNCNRTWCLFSLLSDPAVDARRGPQIIVNSHHVIASAGSNVTLLCDILNFRHIYGGWWWTFNGNSTRLPSPYYSQTEVTFHDRMTMVLDIINASERHIGVYECNIVELTEWFEKNNITLIIDEKGNRRRVFLDSLNLRILITYSRRKVITIWTSTL